LAWDCTRVLGALLGTEHTLQPGGQASVLGHEAIHVMVEVSHRVRLAHEIAWVVLAVHLPEPASSDGLAPSLQMPRHAGVALL